MVNGHNNIKNNEDGQEEPKFVYEIHIEPVCLCWNDIYAPL